MAKKSGVRRPKLYEQLVRNGMKKKQAKRIANKRNRR